MNIIEILKNKPVGTKLYSPVFGECKFEDIDNNTIDVIRKIGNNDASMESYLLDGKYTPEGECVLFPSKEMHDWSKFAWQKGDVLSANLKKVNVIFEKFTDDTLKFFKGRHWLEYENRDNVTYNETGIYCTKAFAKTDEVISKCYLDIIEKRLGGRLDTETLEVVKPKWTPKPFDRVVGRNDVGFWEAGIFSNMDKDRNGVSVYSCIGRNYYCCLPYNEETAKLIGTTNEYKENV